MPTRRDRPGPRALAYAVAPGLNSGMGHHAAQVLAACAAAQTPLLLLGPRAHGVSGVELRTPPPLVARWRRQYTWLRYLHGRYQFLSDRRFGRWLASQVKQDLSGCYLFTQIASEALLELNRWNVPSLLDSPNGHIRHFREAVQQEAARWLSGPYPGHPTLAMVDRVEEEYRLAATFEWRVIGPRRP